MNDILVTPPPVVATNARSQFRLTLWLILLIVFIYTPFTLWLELMLGMSIQNIFKVENYAIYKFFSPIYPLLLIFIKPKEFLELIKSLRTVKKLIVVTFVCIIMNGIFLIWIMLLINTPNIDINTLKLASYDYTIWNFSNFNTTFKKYRGGLLDKSKFRELYRTYLISVAVRGSTDIIDDTTYIKYLKDQSTRFGNPLPCRIISEIGLANFAYKNEINNYKR